MISIAHLSEALVSMGLDIHPEAQLRLIDYIGLLSKWNGTYNLTAIHEPAKMLTHHLLDSLAVLPHVKPGRLLDVGSGAGLPGIPLAIARPDLSVTLIDASHKKAAFMQQATIELGLNNVAVIHGRVETLQADPFFAQIISRAFSDLNDLVRLTRHLLAEGGVWLAMKGVYPNEEVRLLRGACISQVHALNVPGLGAERQLIVLGPNEQA